MFAEEVKGNAAKKRQEEAKARRKRLKEQQRKKQAALAVKKDNGSSTGATTGTSTLSVPSGTGEGTPSLSSSPTTTTAASLSSSSVMESATIAVPSQSTVGTSAHLSSTKPTAVAGTKGTGAAAATGTGKGSAVANALQQRQIRQAGQRQTKACIQIQSSIRAFLSNQRLYKEQAGLLDKRLKDLITLRTLLKQKSNTDYIAPPATVSVLVQQLLFLTKSVPRPMRAQVVLLRNPHSDIVRTQSLLQFVLVPAIVGDDENLDPMLPWLDHPTRIMDLLRLVLVIAVRPGVQKTTLHPINSFLRAVLGIPHHTTGKMARDSIVRYCRFLLLPITPLARTPRSDDGKPDDKAVPHLNRGSEMDLLHILRNHLLFGKGKKPIPPDAGKVREAAFSASDRDKADNLFLLVLDAVCVTTPNRSGNTTGGVSISVQDRRRLQVRFLTEILTVPLLTWRTSAASVTGLLSVSKLASKPSSASKPSTILMELLDALVGQHGAALSTGRIETILPIVDAPLASCPATNTQCLLANLVQIGRVCPTLNGSSKTVYEGES